AVVPRFWLIQTVDTDKWSHVRAQLADGTLFNPFTGPLHGLSFVEVVLAPNASILDGGDRTCLVTRRAPIPDPGPRPQPPSGCDPIGWFQSGVPSYDGHADFGPLLSVFNTLVPTALSTAGPVVGADPLSLGVIVAALSAE